MKKTFSLCSLFILILVFIFLFLDEVSIAQSSSIELDLLSWGVYSGPTYISVNGNHLYVSSNAFVVFDITDRDNPVETTHLRPMEPGIPREFVINGNYAYVVWSGSDGIRVFDVSDNDTVITISTGFGAGTNPSELYLKFPYLYAYVQQDSDFYFSVVSISDDSTTLYNARSFDLSESLGITLEHYPAKFIVVGDYAYLTFGPRDTVGTAKLHILDVSSPDSISLIGELDLGTVDASVPGMRNGPHLELACKDTFLYVTGRFQRDTTFGDIDPVEIKILNIANPESVFIAGKFYSTSTLRNISDIDISGNYAYVTDRNSALFVLDISDPLNPVERDSVRMAVPDYYSLDFKVQVAGNYAYLNMWDFYAVCIVDISDADNPEEINRIEFGHQLNDISISRSDSNAYLAVWDYLQLYVVDSMETSPVVINRSVALGKGWGIDVKGDYAYLAMGPANFGIDTIGGLVVFDISNPLSPLQVGQCPTVSPIDSNDIVQVYVDTTEMLAYTVIGEPHYPPCTFAYSTNPGMLIVDVSDPANPFQLGTYFIDPADTMVDEYIQGTSICKSGNYVYLGTSRNGVHIIDVSDPTNPTLLTIWNSELERSVSGIFIKDTLLYVACGDSLCIIDVSDPYVPSQISGFYVNNGCVDVYVKDTLAFVISENALEILDVSCPTSPIELTSVSDIFSGSPSHIDVLGSYIYVQIHCGGIYTFEYFDTSTEINNSSNLIHQSLRLNIYPNPFNSSCVITAPAKAKIEIYDMRGNIVWMMPPSVPTMSGQLLHEGEKQDPIPLREGGSSATSQMRTIIWTPDKSIPSGIYFIRVVTAGQNITRKILLIR